MPGADNFAVGIPEDTDPAAGIGREGTGLGADIAPEVDTAPADTALAADIVGDTVASADTVAAEDTAGGTVVVDIAAVAADSAAADTGSDPAQSWELLSKLQPKSLPTRWQLYIWFASSWTFPAARPAT